MTRDELLTQLNTAQAEAVRHTDGPLLVLAGAGAGKTRVITYKIAYLLDVMKVPPHNILAVTFTNKAAGEMKTRLASLVGFAARNVWMGTFHSIALAILRKYGHLTVAGENFSVVDQDDRISIVRSVVKALNIDFKKYSPKLYMHHISTYKNTMMYVDGHKPGDFFYKFPEVFAAYESELRTQRLIDFDDMLSLSLRLFMQYKEVLQYYKELCRYIMVDEYQDTNAIQFAFLQALAGENGNICVVGDDDQSIYGWRGAEVENILYFDQHFKNVKEIKLVDNYRSAPEILNLANSLIRNNTARRGKELVAKTNRVGEVVFRRLLDERYEADYVAEAIQHRLDTGVPAGEIAVLYRTNAQSRNFEVALNRRRIAYKVVGGVGFYQRREIKDILSYLRVYDNPYDEAAFARALKTPPKGVGDTVIERIRGISDANGHDMLTVAEMLIPQLPSRQAGGLSVLRNIMHGVTASKTLPEMVNVIIEESGYKDYITGSEDPEEAKTRIENIYELYNAAVSYQEQFPDGTVSDFLASTTLHTSTDEPADGVVRLMSMHAAKGLEFESVFLTGFEDGIFPLASQDDDGDIEEERRLCYVGVTRAKVNLDITYAESRLHHGKRSHMKASGFLAELGAFASGGRTKEKNEYFTPADGSLRKGQQVSHEVFGDGIVINITGAGDNAKVDVMFRSKGLKKLVARFLSPK